MKGHSKECTTSFSEYSEVLPKLEADPLIAGHEKNQTEKRHVYGSSWLQPQTPPIAILTIYPTALHAVKLKIWLWKGFGPSQWVAAAQNPLITIFNAH